MCWVLWESSTQQGAVAAALAASAKRPNALIFLTWVPWEPWEPRRTASNFQHCSIVPATPLLASLKEKDREIEHQERIRDHRSFGGGLAQLLQRRRIRPSPLKVGIGKEIAAATEGAVTPEELDAALRIYTGSKMYLKKLKEGAERVDLGGNPAGTVTAA